jgi:alkylhydroperoxidase family enzyme
VLGDAFVKPILADYRSAPMGEKLRAMLAFLEKMTLTPEALDGDDGDRLRAAGVSDAAAEDAMHVAYLFAIHVRMADGLGYTLPTDYSMAPKALLTIGYR